MCARSWITSSVPQEVILYFAPRALLPSVDEALVGFEMLKGFVAFTSEWLKALTPSRPGEKQPEISPEKNRG